jgi:hypothetical protein
LEFVQLYKKPRPSKYTREGSYHIFIFPAAPRALKIWQINSAILKVPGAPWIRQVRIPAAEQFPWNL